MKEVVRQAKIYIRPLQCNLSLTPLQPEFDEVRLYSLTPGVEPDTFKSTCIDLLILIMSIILLHRA